MKVLLDEDVPQPLARVLPPHDIQTVAGMGWAAIKNGRLLELIQNERFDAFITGDKNIPHQQVLAGRPFAVLVLSAISWPVLKRHVSLIAVALAQAIPGTVVSVDCGVFAPRRAGKGRPSREKLEGCLIRMA